MGTSQRPVSCITASTHQTTKQVQYGGKIVLSFLLVSFEVRILYNNPIPSTESVLKLYKTKLLSTGFFWLSQI